ncbi:MAG: 1-deoxy-D-xylulose-5-phosphate reductoisomerase [Actinobacteria bacterium]|nr:1-deoxy-D-xylulose-5-phosphate reductoisomerase [Actinomycetota bacterium]
MAGGDRREHVPDVRVRPRRAAAQGGHQLLPAARRGADAGATSGGYRGQGPGGAHRRERRARVSARGREGGLRGAPQAAGRCGQGRACPSAEAAGAVTGADGAANDAAPRGPAAGAHGTLAAVTDAAPRHLLILGSTGSIGRQALEVLPQIPRLHLVGLAAGRDAAGVVEQARAHGVRDVCLHDAGAAAEATATAPELAVHAGEAGIRELVSGAAERAAAAGAALTVLNGVVGAAGLRSTVATLEAGATLALANKESMVAGGPFVLDAARRSGSLILPVDSEHSALFQCIAAAGPAGAKAAGSKEAAGGDVVAAGRPRALEELLLTGSGGPFRGRTAAELAAVTPEQALAHPNWSMGPKITIDSATLMNKGLELIEAHYLFGVPYEDITVVLDPRSTVHSMARFSDGAILAHLGVPDMRTPIGYALAYPERPPLPQVRRLDVFAAAIAFERPDTSTFRCLALAEEAGTGAMRAEREAEAAGAAPRTVAAPVVLNAANEVAVAAFLEKRLPFLGIAETVEACLDRLGADVLTSLDDVYAADAAARAVAAEAVEARA